jgi:glucan phosphoethanolaminetransferase (alkaline phosphatase superfamily)
MNEVYAFTIILIATAVVIAVVPFIVGVIVKYKQNKENANKKKVYVSTLVITYCGVGTALMNKKELTYRNDSYEEAMKSRKRLIDIANKAHQSFFEGIVVIHKNQFIAIEEATYIEYE